MATLIFQHNPSQPCTWSPISSTFTACLGCNTAEETRFCDGSTTPSWKLCDRHREMKDRGELKFDNEMLTFIRESVYDGTIPKPKPSLIRQDFRTPAPAPSKSTSSPVSNSTTPNPETDLDPEHNLLTNPTLSSNTPPHRPRALRHTAHHILWPIPTSVYSHSKTCFHNPNVRFTSTSTSNSSPNIKLLTTAQLFTLQDKQHTSSMVQLRARATQDWEQGVYESTLDTRVREMRDELMTSRLARGVFFKRCNGLFVNVLGWVWSEEFAGISTVSAATTDEELMTRDVDDRLRGTKDHFGELELTRKEIDVQHDTMNTEHQALTSSNLTPDPSTPAPTPISRSSSSKTQPQTAISASRYLARLSLLPLLTQPQYNLNINLNLNPNSNSDSPTKIIDEDEDLIITCWAWNNHARSQAQRQSQIQNQGLLVNSEVNGTGDVFSRG